MPAGSALLIVYNQNGPILDMSAGLVELMPTFYKILTTNPLQDKSTWDNVPNHNQPLFYAAMTTSGGFTKLWSNIPTFVCVLTFIAMRSDLIDLPEADKLFRFHKAPRPVRYSRSASS
jgi:hypothetical protein